MLAIAVQLTQPNDEPSPRPLRRLRSDNTISTPSGNVRRLQFSEVAGARMDPSHQLDAHTIAALLSKMGKTFHIPSASEFRQMLISLLVNHANTSSLLQGLELVKDAEFGR